MRTVKVRILPPQPIFLRLRISVESLVFVLILIFFRSSYFRWFPTRKAGSIEREMTYGSEIGSQLVADPKNRRAVLKE
jgi:hypothetical protein